MEMTKIKEATAVLQQAGFMEPQVGIILGTGLGKLLNKVNVEKTMDYALIPHFPVSTVESHKGRLIYGELSGKKVVIMQGRFHYYEGYSLQEVTFPIRVMKELGIKNLLISNAAGALNLDYKKGQLMLLDDHINLLTGSPLIGKNLDAMGPRFPDMSRPYSTFLNRFARSIANENRLSLNEGVYVAVTGPNLETRAEYRFLRIIGADAVGMSTVPEVIVANHMSLPCMAVSVLTDECDPDHLQPVSLEEILEVAGLAENELTVLFSELVGKI
jgi:purine-nucleoside phosphorylase